MWPQALLRAQQSWAQAQAQAPAQAALPAPALTLASAQPGGHQLMVQQQPAELPPSQRQVKGPGLVQGMCPQKLGLVRLRAACRDQEAVRQQHRPEMGARARFGQPIHTCSAASCRHMSLLNATTC